MTNINPQTNWYNQLNLCCGTFFEGCIIHGLPCWYQSCIEADTEVRSDPLNHWLVNRKTFFFVPFNHPIFGYIITFQTLVSPFTKKNNKKNHWLWISDWGNTFYFAFSRGDFFFLSSLGFPVHAEQPKFDPELCVFLDTPLYVRSQVRSQGVLHVYIKGLVHMPSMKVRKVACTTCKGFVLWQV